MNRSAHIFQELNALMPEFQKRYKPKDVFYIALRLDNKQVAKVEVFLDEMIPILFRIIDTNNRKDLLPDNWHPIWRVKEYYGRILQSIFICDVTSQTIYDSRQYQESNAKYLLTQDKDGRVAQFKRLDDAAKEQVTDLTICQISQMFDDIDKGQEPNDTGSEQNSWGEMPWDFQE